MTLDRLEKIRKLIRSDIDERAEGLPKEMLEQAYEIVRVIHQHDEMAEVQRAREEQNLPRLWDPVDSVEVPTRMRRRTISAGSPVRVAGFGKRTAQNPDGAAQEGWTVLRIEKRDDEVNVEVIRNGKTRIVNLSKIR